LKSEPQSKTREMASQLRLRTKPNLPNSIQSLGRKKDR
jgi:hypothetical protein